MDEFHRPTATFPSGAYNATQVRLYGLDGIAPPAAFAPAAAAAEPAMSAKPKKNTKAGKIGNYNVEIKISEKDDNNNNNANSNSEMNCLSIDIKLGLVGIYVVTYNDIIMWPAVIYGYAYEGHCYDLPKPKIMLLPVEPLYPIPKDDCGYDVKPGYKVWIIDKLNECVEIDVNRGFAEQLVLEANMPGRRSPSTYRATMAVSHRNGRLME